MNERTYTLFDRALGQFDQALRTVYARARPARPNPASGEDSALNATQRKLVGRLMRVNHTGEICAQALYQGQALTAAQDETRTKMRQASLEENDHLAWTEERVRELGTHTSYLDPLWYAGSFTLGAGAGLCGDRWSLGFLAETERQVVRHLSGHLERLPADDRRSRAIVEQMRDDERRHATTAIDAGGAELPNAVKQLMRLASRVMTGTAHWI